MTQTTTALATARRNVLQRITRFIESLEQAPREPDPWECEHVQRALAALEELDFPRGEQAMMWAEWGPGRRMPDAMKKLQPIYGPASTKELRAHLDRVPQAAA